ncbi:MAG: histidine kinase [Cyclobacteriaceae bacterium]
MPRKHILRSIVGLVIFFFLRLGHEDFMGEFFVFGALDFILMGYTIAMVVLMWEVLDRNFSYFEKQGYNFTSSRDTIKGVLILTLWTGVLISGAVSFSEFYLKPKFDCAILEGTIFRETAQGQILAWLIISARIIRLNSVQNKKLEQDKAMVQKELLLSQYQNLKNQIKPHFLFNSFSVLQALIQVDTDQAEQFLSRLSKMYRYILEYREEPMSSLDKELEILDHYLYLLNVRHEESIVVTLNIDEKALNSFIPTMSLQMLVENAEKHNKFSRKEPLQINIFIEDDYLVVRNQVGKQGAEIVSTKVGLENIKSQYKLQSEKPVVIVHDQEYFTVKMPVLSNLRIA